ncbi:Ulp1 family isopeptidase [Mesorhizobium sp. AaZ16]|uniref:Ulp1 family isopeptidase n=1 Tax=Mesorhizobium sp. AaZ16 TaxID=3402289 RepID=UPI00374E404A
MGEARRAAARVPAASVSALPDPFHPYLSQADLSLTHAAVQADAEPVHLSVLAIDPDELQRTPEHPPFSPLRFDQDPRESFPPLSWRHDSQQAADELMAALPSFRSGEEVLANGLHNTGELRSTKRQRTLNNLHHAVSERQPSEIGNSGARVPMQPPTHQVGTSEWEAQLVMRGDEHEYTPAPHPGGGGSMPSAVQPDRPIVVPDGRDKRPVYSNDATAIEGLRSALRAGKAKANTVTNNVNSLFTFSRWLLDNNRPGFAARLYHPSLDQDLKEYESKGGSSTVAGALGYLKKSTGGAALIVARAVLTPHPDDAALIRNYRAALTKEYQASPATGPNPGTVGSYAIALRRFSQYLHQNNKPGIAARIYDKSLDKDVESYKASASNVEVRVSAALVHLRNFLPRLVLGREIVLAAHPENAVGMEARPHGDAAQHSALQQAFDWPEELLPEGHEEGTALPLSLVPTAHHQAPDFGEAVPHLNWRYGDQHAPDELFAARDRSNLLPSEEVPHRYGRGLAMQPRLWAENSASPELFRRTTEQALPAFARAEETPSAVDEATQAAQQALAWLQEEMEETEPMQDPHQVDTSEWEAQLVMRGDEHEYTPAPPPGGGGSMPSAVQPDRPIVVPDGRDKRPVYSNDATAIEGLRAALRAGKAKANTVTNNVNSLFTFSRWLLDNNRPGFAARLYHPSLDQDLKEYESKGGSSTVAGALGYLKKSTGGAAPIVARPVLTPHPDDAALIRNYRAALTKEYEASPATGTNPDTVGGYANALRRFSQYLRQNNKPGIAARINDKSLDKDVEICKASASYLKVRLGAALAHLRKSLPRLVLGREIALAAHPEDAVAKRVGDVSEAAPAPPARARQPASPATAGLPDTYRGLPVVDVTTLTTSSSDAQIGAFDPTAASKVANGSVLGATEWLSDAHIQRDYQLLEGQLQRIDPTLAARTRLVDPSVSHLLRHMAPQDARGTLQSIYNQSNAPADFLFLPVNNGTPTSPGTHWSLLLVDRRDPERRFAYHYDSLQREGYNDAPARQLAGLLNATLAPARMARQPNGYDCGVFVVDGTWALVGRLIDGERPDHEPLPLDKLVADRQALQDRLRGRLPHEQEPRQLLDAEPASPPMMAFDPAELRRLLDDEPASSSPRGISIPHARTDRVHQPTQAPWLPERKR